MAFGELPGRGPHLFIWYHISFFVKAHTIIISHRILSRCISGPRTLCHDQQGMQEQKSDALC